MMKKTEGSWRDPNEFGNIKVGCEVDSLEVGRNIILSKYCNLNVGLLLFRSLIRSIKFIEFELRRSASSCWSVGTSF